MTKFNIEVGTVEVDAADESEAYFKLARHFGCLSDGIEPDAGLDDLEVTVAEKSRRTTKK